VRCAYQQIARCLQRLRIYGNATRAAGTIVDIILLHGPVLPPGGLLCVYDVAVSPPLLLPSVESPSSGVFRREFVGSNPLRDLADEKYSPCNLTYFKSSITYNVTDITLQFAQ